MQDEPKKERPSTYYVQDRQNKQELARLTIQGQMMTNAMSGSLPEQTEPARFRRILDVACGPGEWVIATAKAYPSMSLTGIDISQSMIEYARERAIAEQVADRVEFRVMDALRMLEFPDNFFDLVNLRCCVGFMRTWDWPKMISEMVRVTRKRGVVRVTDADAEAGRTRNPSPALMQFSTMTQKALFQAGHLFEESPTGLTAHLASLLQQYGCKGVQTATYSMIHQAGDPSGQAYYEDMSRAFQTLRPFILKWGYNIKDDEYDIMHERVLAEIQRSDFYATWNLLTAWGTK